MTKNKVLWIVLLAAVAGVVGYFYVSRPTARVANVQGGQAVKAVPGSVIVQAEFEMNLKSAVGGRVVKSELDPGKSVKEGDVLVQLDTGDLELEIEGKQTEYEATQKRIAVGSQLELDYETQKEIYANFERLTATGNYSQADLTKQARILKQAQQKVELEKVANQQLLEILENTLKVKKRQLEKMTIIAPFDGTISTVYARPGDLIDSNAAIATVISTSRTVEARISEENFAGLKIGQPSLVRFLSYGAFLYNAKITKILPTADPDTQRYIVHLQVTDIEAEKLVPGITGEANITVGERQAKAIVPRRALFGNHVYLVKDGRVKLQEVEVGYNSLTFTEILKGVEPGDQVIVDELDTFRDGDRVRTAVVETEKK